MDNSELSTVMLITYSHPIFRYVDNFIHICIYVEWIIDLCNTVIMCGRLNFYFVDNFIPVIISIRLSYPQFGKENRKDCGFLGL